MSNTPSPIHKSIFALLSGRASVIAIPRGFAKTTIACFIDVLHKAIFGNNHFILLCAASQNRADETVAQIKSELEENERIKQDFAPFLGKTDDVKYRWTQSDIVITVNGHSCRVLGVGAGAAVRGVRFRQYRPDHIVADDLETDESVLSPDRVNKTLRWITRSLIPALSPSGGSETKGGSIAILGTVLSRRGVMGHLLGLAGNEDSARYQESFRQIRFAAVNAKGGACGRQFPDEYLQQIRHTIGEAAWQAEYMNDPLDDDGAFRQEWIHRWSELPVKMTVWGAVDPALGNVHGDYTTIITIGCAGGKIYVLSAVIEKITPERTKRLLSEEYMRFNHVQIAVESNGFQALYADRIQSNVPMPLQAVRHSEPKRVRVMRLAPMFERGEILFPPLADNTQGHEKLIQQLLAFPHGAHDDGPDALASAVSLINTTRQFIGLVF
jgi:predicted phage terminase large subunit-like protein